MVSRVKTEIKGLDNLLQGGLPKGSITMITGGPGTGKSILCQEILYKNAANGAKCLYASFEQSETDIKTQMKQFGWNPDKVKGKLKILSLDLSGEGVVDYLLEEFNKSKFDLVAIDSIASLYINPIPASKKHMNLVEINDTVTPIPSTEGMLKKLEIRDIIKPMRKSSTTVLLINQIIPGQPGYSRDEVSEYLCDSLVKLNYSGVAGGASRSLEIVKMRFTKFSEGIMPLEITKKGILVKSLDEKL